MKDAYLHVLDSGAWGTGGTDEIKFLSLLLLLGRDLISASEKNHSSLWL